MDWKHYIKRGIEKSVKCRKDLKAFPYNWSCRKRLKNSEFTIICSNCIGGILYHRYGMKFMSPTVNLFFEAKDFVIFCEYLREYVEGGYLVFIETDKNYPVAYLKYEGLPDVKIYFMHYLNEEEARSKWVERCKRVNYNNLYIVGADVGLDRADVIRLTKVNSKGTVIFTAGEYDDLPNTFCLEKRRGMKDVGKYLDDEIPQKGIKYVETVFDFTDFFNR